MFSVNKGDFYNNTYKWILLRDQAYQYQVIIYILQSFMAIF